MSKELRLKHLQYEQLEEVLEWRNAPGVRKNMYTTHVISLKEHKDWYERVQHDNTKEYFVAFLDNVPVGVVGFSDIDSNSGIATWAFYASPEAPRGTGSMMEFYALDYAFKELKLHKLRCEVLDFNQAVVKLHKKFGFSVEGQHRDAHYDGEKYHDVVHLGIFSSEWDAVREPLKVKLKIH